MSPFAAAMSASAVTMRPLVVILGATASGKTALSLALAQRFGGEVLSCDSVAVYRHMELGTAKPTLHQRSLVQHHLLDLCDPDEACTAGDYARHARAVLGGLAERNVLPIVSGGTGLYLRAFLDGLFATPAKDPALRLLLRERAARRGHASLHRTLARLDGQAAQRIHVNDVSKIVRAIEVSLLARRPMSELWQESATAPPHSGARALEGYSILRLGLAPTRVDLYRRIDRRAEAMFANGLVEETRSLVERFGPNCRPLTSLGYAEAGAELRNELTQAQAIAKAQQGHRNYAKRQTTWFRREGELHPVHWLAGAGDDPAVLREAIGLVEQHLNAGAAPGRPQAVS